MRIILLLIFANALFFLIHDGIESSTSPKFIDVFFWFIFLGNLILSLHFWLNQKRFRLRALRFVLGVASATFGLVLGGLLAFHLGSFFSLFAALISFVTFFFFGFQDIIRTFYSPRLGVEGRE
ncbi:MAG: hypothetical protein ACI9YL_002016 [Luteibaculaceae bacterium]|jgi:hypothetical protein